MIKKIHLTNFRCFDDISFDTYNSLVILSGKNATGKSSTLESIFIASTSKSYRENDLDLVIKNGKDKWSSVVESSHWQKNWELRWKISQFKNQESL